MSCCLFTAFEPNRLVLVLDQILVLVLVLVPVLVVVLVRGQGSDQGVLCRPDDSVFHNIKAWTRNQEPEPAGGTPDPWVIQKTTITGRSHDPHRQDWLAKIPHIFL